MCVLYIWKIIWTFGDIITANLFWRKIYESKWAWRGGGLNHRHIQGVWLHITFANQCLISRQRVVHRLTWINYSAICGADSGWLRFKTQRIDIDPVTWWFGNEIMSQCTMIDPCTMYYRNENRSSVPYADIPHTFKVVCLKRHTSKP